MNTDIDIRGLAVAVALTIALAGCSTYRKCGMSGCSGDAEITANVNALFKQHTELESPNTISVQTLDGVVYLTGLVDTGLEKAIAESVAMQTPGVTRVVSSLGIRGYNR